MTLGEDVLVGVFLSAKSPSIRYAWQ